MIPAIVIAIARRALDPGLVVATVFATTKIPARCTILTWFECAALTTVTACPEFLARSTIRTIGALRPVLTIEARGGRISLVTRLLPDRWYDTPNIHHVTIDDFRAMVRERGWTIDGQWFLNDGRETGSANANLFAEHAVFLLRG